MRAQGYQVLAVDFDPDAVQRHARDGYAVHYGDIEDPELIASLPLARSRWVVCTVRDYTINHMLLHALHQQGYQGKIALSTSSRHDALRLEAEGVDLSLIHISEPTRPY
mgnify:CR=1 FL=1